MKFTKAFLFAARPHTLCVSLCSIILAGSYAYHIDSFKLISFLMASISLLLLQAASNCLNDYCDFEKGVDREERIGFTRVMQAGLMTPLLMRQSILSLFVLAYLISLPLLFKSFFLLPIIVFASYISIFYSAGEKPLGHRALGELCVFLCFGPLAVGGIFIAQTQKIDFQLLQYSIIPGLWATFLMSINNYRDMKSDALAGKYTLAIYLGEARMRYFCYSCLVCLGVFSELFFSKAGLYFALPLIYLFFRIKQKKRVNQTLLIACQFALLHTVLFSYLLLVS